MSIEATITGKRQITIPKEVYETLQLTNTDKVSFEVNEYNEVVIKKVKEVEYDKCPVCKRKIKDDKSFVVSNNQKYHISCWSLDSTINNINEGYIANSITEEQKYRLKVIQLIKKDYLEEEIKILKDNEAIIEVPTKITFMETDSSKIGCVTDYNANKIFEANCVTSNMLDGDFK